MKKSKLALVLFLLAFIWACDTPVGSNPGGLSPNPTQVTLSYRSDLAVDGEAPSSVTLPAGSSVVIGKGDLARYFIHPTLHTYTVWHFVGWTSEPGNEGTVYHPGRTLELTEDLTLYPRWSGQNGPTYQVQYTTGILYTGAPVDTNYYLAGDWALVLPLAEDNNLHPDELPRAYWQARSPAEGNLPPGSLVEIPEEAPGIVYLDLRIGG